MCGTADGNYWEDKLLVLSPKSPNHNVHEDTDKTTTHMVVCKHTHTHTDSLSMRKLKVDAGSFFADLNMSLYPSWGTDI